MARDDVLRADVAATGGDVDGLLARRMSPAAVDGIEVQRVLAIQRELEHATAGMMAEHDARLAVLEREAAFVARVVEPTDAFVHARAPFRRSILQRGLGWAYSAQAAVRSVRRSAPGAPRS